METDTNGWLGTLRSGGVRIPPALMVFVVVGCAGSESTGDLIDLAKSKNSADRSRAVTALGDRGRQADTVVPVLIEALSDKDAFVRRDAARALGQFGRAASVAAPTLHIATTDKNRQVRQAAADALRKIAPEPPSESESR